jgi:YidC/Oxa1 family membrane protein insertase
VVTLLTKSSSWLGPIASILGLIMNAIYEFFHLFGIQNIALSIIVFTFIVKTLMLPLTIKQQKFTKLSSRMNPELQKIQAKYKGKKDEASLKKQQTETQAVYQKYGASPTSGCLPILITLPIMFALYSVINNIPAYVDQVKQLYETVAVQIQTTAGYQNTLTTLSEGLRITKSDFSTTNQIIDVLAKFGTDKWVELSNSFPALKDTITSSSLAIQKVNGFLGLNIANAPGWRFPGILIPFIAMALQFVQGKQLEVKNKTSNKDNPTASAMSSMTYVMPVMSGVFCITLPTGIGLYWIATSVFAIIQQYFVNKYMDRVDVDELIEKNVAKASKRKSYAASGASLQELAKKQTKSIETTVSGKEKRAESLDTKEKQNEVEEETTEVEQTSPSSNGPKSISEIANLLRNRNSEKGDK